jgi:DDE family transposase
MDRLWDQLERLPDHRTLKGRRYALAAIVGISLAAMLSGANDLMAIFRWGRRLTPKGLAAFGIGHGRAPCHATYHYVFRSIAAADLERALRGSVPSGSAGHVAIDGKRLRGSQSANSPGIHVLQAFSTGLQASIGALAVPPDSAEVVEAIALLKDLPIGAGDVVTGDAAFTYRSIIEAIRAKGAGYFLFVKANQPELQAEIAHAFGDDSPCTGGRTARCPEPAGRSA